MQQTHAAHAKIVSVFGYQNRWCEPHKLTGAAAAAAAAVCVGEVAFAERRWE